MKHQEGINLTVAAVTAGLAWVGYLTRPFGLSPEWSGRLWLSVAIIAIAFFVREILLRQVHPKLAGSWGRYLFRKITLVLFWGVTFYVVLTLWVFNITWLPVTLGLIAAGLAVAFQRPIMSVLGLFVILINRPFRVGDRIEVKGMRGEVLTRGDVIDIRPLYTTLMEVGEWMGGEVWTGRLVTVPNYRFLENEVANSTKDFGYVWDLATIPITYSSDWRKARIVLIASIEKVVGHLKKDAKTDLQEMARRYLTATEDVEPRAYITIQESWIELSARYLTVPRGRRTIRSRIHQEFLERIRGDPDISLASPQLRVYPFPPESYRAGMRPEEGATPWEGEAEAAPAAQVRPDDISLADVRGQLGRAAAEYRQDTSRSGSGGGMDDA